MVSCTAVLAFVHWCLVLCRVVWCRVVVACWVAGIALCRLPLDDFGQVLV